MMFIVPPTISMDVVRQHQAQLRAAAEQHRRLHPESSRRRRFEGTAVRVEHSSARQRRRTAHRDGWLPRWRGAALKQS